MFITLFPYVQVFLFALCFETDVNCGIQKKTTCHTQNMCVLILMSWLSVVAVVTTLWAWQQGNPGIFPGLDKRFFSSLVSRLLLGAVHPPARWVLGVNWSVCKAHHSSPAVVEVKNKWGGTPSAPYAFITFFTLLCPHPQCWKCRCCHMFSNCIMMGIFGTFSFWIYHEVVRSGLICIGAGCIFRCFIYTVLAAADSVFCVLFVI